MEGRVRSMSLPAVRMREQRNLALAAMVAESKKVRSRLNVSNREG
jgi:hypothetical protein